MITSKRYCNNCADEGPDYEGRKPKTQEILGWYEVTDKEKKDGIPIDDHVCCDGFLHKCQVCGFKKRMHLTLAEWKKLTDSDKQKLCDHAFKLINSKKVDVIRDGMLEIQGNIRDPDLIKPVIPRLLDFLKEDFGDFIVEEEDDYDEDNEDDEDQTIQQIDFSESAIDFPIPPAPEVRIGIQIGTSKPAPPGTLIRNAAIRTFGIVGRRKPELFSAAVPLIEKLIPNEESFSDESYYDPPEFHWVVDHAINTLRILKVEEKILEKYEKIHQRLLREDLQLYSDGYSWNPSEVWYDKRGRRRVGRYVKDGFMDHGSEPVRDKSYVGVPDVSDT